MYDRSSLDLSVSTADRQLSTSALIARQKSNSSTIDRVLLERMHDSGRYLFVSSSGVLPPRLTGIWSGTWSGCWADDITTDANINIRSGENGLSADVQGNSTDNRAKVIQWPAGSGWNQEW
ncbi:RICIN domain-containing protein [Streptomyces sp. NPDC013187]|uniref:RICIN domain-containing protein n=1 Tax=Streptomyces sp. NPDC013187 TaxID=3364865 RepID=UPI0036881B10